MKKNGGASMTTWTSDELDKIGNAEELQLQSLRRDGTLRSPVTMWVVRVGDELFVRAVHGRNSPWFCGVQTRHTGHIRAGGIEKDVTFVEEANPDLNNMIDTAYLTKYARYPQYVAPMVTPEVRAATIKLVPRLTVS
jgi:hypothetical protein